MTQKQTTKLETLERWRTSQLERAQEQHASERRIVEDRERAVVAVQKTIDDSQGLAREQTAGAHVISADALTRIRYFTALQLEALKQAASSLAESQRSAERARVEMVKKFEELSVVERLRERIARTTQRDAARREQIRLDDQALMRSVRTKDDGALQRDPTSSIVNPGTASADQSGEQ